MLRRTVLLFLLTAAALAQQPKPAPAFRPEPYTLPAYEQAPGLAKSVSKADYASALRDDRYIMQKLQYDSDGLPVIAYLYGPRTSSQKLPLIIYNRGGYIAHDMAPELLPQFHRFAEAGFLVLAPMYRQSEGAGGVDEVGGQDLDDLLNLRALLPSMSGVDTGNIFLVGESRGGMMVYQALREGFPARAAAVYGAFADFQQLVQAQPQLYGPLLNKIFPEYQQRSAEIAQRRSAVMWADKINTPILIMQGGNDKSVSPTQSLKMAEKLEEAGKTYELLIVPGENHTMSHDANRRDSTIVAWFREQMSSPAAKASN